MLALASNFTSTGGTIIAQAGSVVSLGKPSTLSNTSVVAASGGTVDFNQQLSMTGGILQSQGSGKIVVNFPIGNGIYQPTNIVSLSGVNNQSNFEVQGGMLTLSGSITNSGNLSVVSTNTFTYDSSLSTAAPRRFPAAAPSR